MKIIAIRKEKTGSLYMDKHFFDRFAEEDLETYGYTNVEAPEDCDVSDFNDDLTFSEEKYNQRKGREVNAERLNALENWFNYYFDKQIIQSQWQENFKVSHDDYFNKDYENIDELKAQAEIVRQEIKNLRKAMLGVEKDV